MKIKTIQSILGYMQADKIYFSDESDLILIRLTKGEVRGIIATEYGIRPKRARIIKKKLKTIMDDVLRYALGM